MTKSKTPTVVFLHGAWASPSCFNFIRSQLPTHRAILPEYDFGPALYDTVQLVACFVNQHLAYSNYILIGHSLGGVLGYQLALDDPRCIGLITISSPFGGSVHAATLHNIIAPWPPKTDLVPNSEFLTQIKRNKLQCPGMSLISTGGKMPLFNEPNDNVVSVATQVASPIQNQIYIPATHTEILQHEETTQAIRTFL
jgi:pimeloyl-ACP methyl ester carboxylesterase